MQGYEKANATQTTMYQVRWGADYLMKLVGSGTGNSTTVTYLELIYQVHLCLPPCAAHSQLCALAHCAAGQVLCCWCCTRRCLLLAADLCDVSPCAGLPAML